MKSKIKITKKFLENLGLDLDPKKFVGTVVKRMSYHSDIDEVLPHERDGYSFGRIMTIDVDGDGDVMIPDGVDLTRYQKNPVVLFNHHRDKPIGFAEKMSVTREDITSKTRYGTTEEAQKIYQLVRDKVLRTHSVGFIPIEVAIKGRPGFKEAAGKLRKLFPEKFTEENVKKIDRIILKSIMVEYSIVTIPSNEDAVMLEVKSLSTKKESPESFGAVMAMLPTSLAARIKGFSGMIPDEYINEDGREDEPHITVKYGIHTKDASEIQKLLAGEKPIEATMKRTTIFKNEDSFVLKIDVESEDLNRLNSMISEGTEVTDTYSDYKPHITIAYLKPVEDEEDEPYRKYMVDMFDGEKVYFNELEFSSSDGERSNIILEEEIEPPLTKDIEKQVVEIKVLSRATQIKKVSTIEQREAKKLQQLYRKMWGC